MNWEDSGSWYSLELVERHTERWSVREQDQCRIDNSRHMVWIPNGLAQSKGLYGQGGEWQPPPRGELKRPNDRGVLRFLAAVCREQVPA